MIKTITTKEEIEFIGVIKNKLLYIKYRYKENLVFINLKHLEIALKTYNDNIYYYIRVINDFILQFGFEKGKLTMKKYIFNFYYSTMKVKIIP